MLENLVKHLISNNEKSAALNLLSTLEKHAWQFNEYDDLAKVYFKIKDYDNAITCAENALITAYTNPKMWTARCNLINVYNHANCPEIAMKYIHQCEISNPNYVDNKLEKAYSYFLLNQKDKAEEILIDVLENTKDLPEEYITKIKFNLGTYCLYRDEFQKGLKLFLLEGKKLSYWQNAKLKFKFWNGGISPGKNIILFAEAGIGDEIINVRFMKHFQKFGMNPIWLTDRKDMVEIFNKNGFKAISNIREVAHLKDNLVWTYPMAVPIYLNLKYKDLWDGPYLKADEEYIKKWNCISTKSNKLKVGLRWSGNPEYDQDLHRSIKLSDIYPLVKQHELISLQRDTNLDETLPDMLDLSSKLTTFEDTLAVISHLDIVITSCTSIAHAAAAMGKTTFIFVPISAYYLYCNTYGNKTPWYGDNVTVLRQIKNKSWKEPIEELQTCLSKY